MNRIIVTPLLIAVAITTGCAFSRQREQVHDVSAYAGPGDRVALLPASLCHPVRVAPTARRTGDITKQDWTEIVSLTGRLPGLTDEERTIKWLWCEGRPATTVRVALGPHTDYTEVTFIREDGGWVLGSVAWVIVD
jgi:hypothetical protein